MNEVTSGALVHMRHIRKADLCAVGVRAWSRRTGIDCARLAEGIPVEELEATGDPFAVRVATIAREDHGC